MLNVGGSGSNVIAIDGYCALFSVQVIGVTLAKGVRKNLTARLVELCSLILRENLD